MVSGMDGVTASPRVLVVDDDPDVLSSLERGLRLSGFDVSTAVDGAEALRSATETRPDAIVHVESVRRAKLVAHLADGLARYEAIERATFVLFSEGHLRVFERSLAGLRG